MGQIFPMWQQRGPLPPRCTSGLYNISSVTCIIWFRRFLCVNIDLFLCLSTSDSKFIMAKKPFSIDDAFDENLDDVVVRVYGSTTIENKPSVNGGRSANSLAKGLPSDSTSSNVAGVANNNPVLLSIRTGIMQDDTASKDSDSLIHESYQYPASYFDPERIWWKHPRVKENWKVVVAAFALIVIGLGLFATGIAVLVLPFGGVQGLVFLIAGLICFIPGAYHVTYIYLAVKGRKGYDFYHLPLFN